MAFDRSWVGRNRYNEAKYLREEYKSGVDSFIKFALDNLQEEDNGLIRCPCKECKNKHYKNPSTVKVDLYRHGIMQYWYTRWDSHEEKDMSRDEVGTSSLNTNYRDDMYDAYDDDFEDLHNRLRRNEAPKKFHDVNLLEVYTYPTHPSLWSGDRTLGGDEHGLVTYYVLIISPQVGKYSRLGMGSERRRTTAGFTDGGGGVDEFSTAWNSSILNSMPLVKSASEGKNILEELKTMKEETTDTTIWMIFAIKVHGHLGRSKQ
ncbi:hypothetical protein POM88_044202 [Heracleum sosnowskyi]|uniref:Transposase-associated domain-containing protein n=1 Tax=Heracleum sosnowskyi TaxID=360622 RepID=A0AAD8H4R2_9APIA|nr:hypothetical protein POM88_044202 [Heracleum sosnowskyi]